MLEKVFYDKELRHSSTISYFAYKDCESVKRMLSHFQEFKICARSSGNTNVLSALLDYEKAIENCEFTESQKRRLLLWMESYSMTDIAYTEGVSVSSIHRTINSLCYRIYRELVNDE